MRKEIDSFQELYPKIIEVIKVKNLISKGHVLDIFLYCLICVYGGLGFKPEENMLIAIYIEVFRCSEDNGHLSIDNRDIEKVLRSNKEN